MSETTQETHTLGPWHVFAGSLGVFNDCDVIYSAHVEDAIVCSMGHDLPEVNANARLIAAAPDLLEALKSLVNETSGFLSSMAAIDVHGYTNIAVLAMRLETARAAIEKAVPR